MNPVLNRIYKWWRRPYERQQQIIRLLSDIEDGQRFDRVITAYWRINMNEAVSNIELALDRAALKLATTQGDVTALVNAVTSLSNVALALALDVKSLRADAPKTDNVADIARVQGKAEGLLALVTAVDETVKSVVDGAIIATDVADDELAPAPAVEVSEPKVQEPGTAIVAVESAPAAEEPASDAPVVSDAPAVVDGEPTPQA